MEKNYLGPKQPWWKRFFSFLFPIRIEQVPSKYSGKLEIIFSKGRYSLCTAHAMYSYEDLYVNFRDSFAQIDLNKFQIQKVLLLGVGLCSVPLILEKIYNKSYEYTAVDIDPAIIELAKKYGIPLLHSPVHLHCADAFAFVSQDKNQYDLIIVDIFIDDVVPSNFEKSEFLTQVRQHLKPQGLVMYNRMALSPEALEKTEHFFQQQFKVAFPQAEMLTIGGNKMLLSRNHLG